MTITEEIKQHEMHIDRKKEILRTWDCFLSVSTVCVLSYLCTCVVLIVCVDCLFPLRDVLTPREKKRYGWPAGNSFSCSAKMASATNLQDRPVPSSIARYRSLQSTSGKYRRGRNSDTVKVPLHERVRHFPYENFIVREGKLFCNVRRQILSTKKSVLKINVSCKKHQDGKQKMKRSKLREQTIAEAFKREEEENGEREEVASQKIALCL